MPCPARDMRAALMLKLGCVESRGQRHMRYHVYRDGQLIARTIMSHGIRELSDGLIGQMAKQLCIRTQVLRQIYECPYGWDEYLESYNPDLNPLRPQGARD